MRLTSTEEIERRAGKDRVGEATFEATRQECALRHVRARLIHEAANLEAIDGLHGADREIQVALVGFLEMVDRDMDVLVRRAQERRESAVVGL